MDAAIYTREEILAHFAKGRFCSQCTLAPWADGLGYGEEELLRMTAAFPGGMHRGDTCGAVVGALIALGLAYGDDMALTTQKVTEFQTAFTERFGSTICRELLGFDFSVPGDRERAQESGKMSELCPGFVRGASEILRELLKDA